VRIDEVENGIVSGYQVLEGNPDDTTAWMPALQQHQACFGRAPKMATADRGFFSAKNEREAQELGVKKVALPGRGRLSVKRAKKQKERWFRRALRWRAGCEATISTLKHPFSMLRATSKRPWISALRGLVCDYQESVFHSSLSRAQEEQWQARLIPLRNDASCWARLHVWQKSLFSEPYRKLTAPADKRAATAKETDPSMVRI
jgi:hypothetical protein